MRTPPLPEAGFLLLAAAAPLFAADSVVTFNEIHYHPVDELNQTEWVELHNLMGVNVDLSGWRLAGGVDYRFADGTVIPGHGFMVVAADPNDPTLAGVGALGPFTGRLANGGETIRLVNNSERTMDLLNYGDSGDWPVGPDGLGPTLAKRDGNSAEARPFNWVSSEQVGGTPGVANFSRAGAPAPDLVISEIASAGDPNFRMEIANVGTSAIDLDGYELRFSSGATQALPTVVLEPDEYHVIAPSFAPAAGDRLALFRPGGAELADARAVTNRLRGLSGDRWLYPKAPSFGGPNPFEFETDIVINEVMYNPFPIRDPVFRRSDEQWIELFNKGDAEVDLSGWRFDDGIDFEFAEGTVLGAGDYLVIARDAAVLAARFPDLAIAGEWNGSLSRKGERLRLIDGNRNPVDEVRY
ncbi:MAG: lamin tail domain-containing protein, partial [Akkermansiaceae bacterium]|nr:lamin tail domain-containing protein [Akkermansiaceae bacterium]